MRYAEKRANNNMGNDGLMTYSCSEISFCRKTCVGSGKPGVLARGTDKTKNNIGEKYSQTIYASVGVGK
jgi:hypothetical protein